MRIMRKTMVASLSILAFLLVMPLEIMRGIIKKLSGRNAGQMKFASEVYAEVFCQVEEAVSILLPGARNVKEEVKTLTDEQKKTIQEKAGVEFDPEYDKEFHFFTSSDGTAVLDTVKGKWGPITFMLAFDKDNKIRDIVVLELKERRGRPVKDRKFLDQYIGKSIADPIKLKKDIKGIAGATISSRQMTDGIRKLAYIYEELYRK